LHERRSHSHRDPGALSIRPIAAATRV
jgi:hypothetical protein